VTSEPQCICLSCALALMSGFLLSPLPRSEPALSLHTVASPLTDCTGTGAVRTADPPVWELVCAVDCPGVQRCKPRDGNDAIGDFKFCGCSDADTDSCCTVVLRPDESSPPVWEPYAYGSCPPCPSTGVCELDIYTEPHCEPP